MPTLQEIYEEELRMRKLRMLVDLTAQKLRVLDLSKEDGIKLIEETKQQVLELFPDKESQFELIYRPRFLRILGENIALRNAGTE
jgi:hypothetical protein